MHETGLCDAIVQAVLHRAEGRRVSAVRVRVGGHVGGHEIDPAVIDQGFRVAASGTPAQDADVEVVIEPLSVRCRDCGGEGAALDATALVACPRCGGVDIEVTGGADVQLEAITFQPGNGDGDHCVRGHRDEELPADHHGDGELLVDNRCVHGHRDEVLLVDNHCVHSRGHEGLLVGGHCAHSHSGGSKGGCGDGGGVT